MSLLRFNCLTDFDTKKLGFSLRKSRSLDLPPPNVIRNSFEASEFNTTEGILFN